MHAVVELLLGRQLDVRHGPRLEGQRSRHAVLILAERIGHGGPTAGDLAVLQERQPDGGRHRQRGHRGESQQPADLAGSPEGRDEEQRHRQPQEQGFIRPRKQMDRQAQAQQRRIPPAAHLAQSRQRAKYQAARRGSQGAAPIAVHPLAEGPEFHHRQRPAGQRPARRGPAAQHPVAQGAKGRGGEHHSRPGSSKDHPPERHGEPLPQRIDGTVGRLLQDEEGLEELVQGMHRIGQPEVPQGVGHQQVAELVVDIRRGRRMVRQQSQPQHYRQRREQRHRPDGSPGQAAGSRLQVLAPQQRGQQEQDAQQQFQIVARAKSQGILDG